MNDLIDYGMIREIASRITRICHTRQLTRDDFYHLLKDHENSPINDTEKRYGFKLDLSNKQINDLVDECFLSGLGIRSVKQKLTCIADDMLFEKFSKNVPKYSL